MGRPPQLLIRYLLPFVALAMTVGVHVALSKVLPKGMDFPYAFFYLIAVFVVAWVAGYLPGVLICLLTTVVLPYVTKKDFRINNVDPARLGVLVAVSLGISGVASAQRRSRNVLALANVELDKRVQSRTEELALVVRDLEAEVAERQKTELRLQTQLERLNLLDEITRAIGERQDLQSIFQVAIRSLEDNLPIDFGCVCLADETSDVHTVTAVGVRSEDLSMSLALTERSRIEAARNGLSRCLAGQILYEPDTGQVGLPLPQQLSNAGLSSMVAAPLLVESQVFGMLIAARREANSFSSADCEFLRQLSEHVALAANQAKVHEALQRAYDELRQTQQTVMQQERLRALGQMASGIAHDINNAISPVSLYTEMLLEREPNLSPRTREYLEITQLAIGDVASTVARMREFYRQQEPQLTLAPVDLSRLVSQVQELTRARWSDMPQQRGVVIQLQTELAPDLPPINGIESEIREALINLIFNAVDAMPEGGVLSLRTKLAEDQETVQVEVADTGIGMEEDTLRCCLEPFFTTKGERGTGLGLAMVYGTTQRHNATIELESEAAKGTLARLNFPVPASAGETALSPADNKIPSRLRVLIVDDDPLVIKAVRHTLEGDGHVVTTANGGQAGIDTFVTAHQGGARFSVVITDLGMPYVDGRKVASAIKTASPETPVILMTGWGQRLLADGEVPPHVDRVLNKPPKLSELRAALADLANHSLPHSISANAGKW